MSSARRPAAAWWYGGAEVRAGRGGGHRARRGKQLLGPAHRLRGYMIPGATGQMEGESPRMVSTPWLDHEVTMSEAAELGTTRVIREHSTIGVVVTTDGSITDIPREDYIEAEGRVIRELQEIGKPFLVLLNATEPESDRVQVMARDIASRYGVTMSARQLPDARRQRSGNDSQSHPLRIPTLRARPLYPAVGRGAFRRSPIKSGLYQAIRENTGSLHCIREVQGATAPSAAAKASAARASRPFSSARALPRRNCSSRARCSTGR